MVNKQQLRWKWQAKDRPYQARIKLGTLCWPSGGLPLTGWEGTLLSHELETRTWCRILFRNVQFYPTSSPMVASLLKPAQAGFCVLQAPFWQVKWNPNIFQLNLDFLRIVLYDGFSTKQFGSLSWNCRLHQFRNNLTRKSSLKMLPLPSQFVKLS